MNWKSNLRIQKAREDIDAYLKGLNEYLDNELTVNIFYDSPEYWYLISDVRGELTSGDPYDIVSRLKQIAKEHGAQWELPELDPESWWKPEE